MKFESKYNIGDGVWYIDPDNKPLPKAKQIFINNIMVLAGKDKTYIHYNGLETENWESIPEKLKEENLFPSKQELLNSL